MVGVPPARIGYMAGRLVKFFSGQQPPISKIKDVVQKVSAETQIPGGTRKQLNVGVVKISKTKGVTPSETKVIFPGELTFKKSTPSTIRSTVEVSARPEVTSIPKQVVQSGSTTTMQRGPKVYTKLTTQRDLSITPFGEGPVVDMSRGFVYDVLPGRMKWTTKKAPTKGEIFEQKKALRESGIDPGQYMLHFDEMDQQVATPRSPALSFFFKSQTKAGKTPESVSKGFGGDITTIDWERSPTVHSIIDWRLDGPTRSKPYQQLRDDFYNIYGPGEISGRYNLYTRPHGGRKGRVKSHFDEMDKQYADTTKSGPRIGRLKPRIKRKYVTERSIAAGVESKPIGFTGMLTWKKVKGKKPKDEKKGRSQLWLQGEIFGRARGKRFEKKRSFKVPLPVETDVALGGIYGGIPIAGLMTQDLSKVGPTFDKWIETLKR